MTDDDDLRELAEWDWVYAGNFQRLHHPAALTPDADEWRYEDVTTTCGLRFPLAWIPGLGARMGMPRCAQCCDALGWPRGNGSPKNDDALRPLVEARLKEGQQW